MVAQHAETRRVMATTPARADLARDDALYPDLFGDTGAGSYTSMFRLKALVFDRL